MRLELMIEGQEDVSWDQWLALARACEAHGIASLWRSDHYLTLAGRGDRQVLDAWATICALAAVTSTLRLGTLVSPATFRHPSQLAKVVATADHISGGRVDLGLGAGWNEAEHAAYGFGFAELGTRMDVFAEQLEIVHGTWTREEFSFAGAHYTLRGLRARPAPVQRPHPPLVIGGGGGRRSLALAARWGDEYNTPFIGPGRAREIRAGLDSACERAGRDPLPLSVMTAVVAGHDEASLAARLRRLGEKTGDDPDRLRSEPPDGWIVGLADEVVTALRELAGAGVARVMCQQLLHDDLEAVALLGETLGPALA